MNDTREQILRELIGRIAPKADIGFDLEDDLVRELGLDSLAGLRVLAAVEKRFGVRFPDDRLGEYRTMRQLLDFIASAEGQAK